MASFDNSDAVTLFAKEFMTQDRSLFSDMETVQEKENVQKLKCSRGKCLQYQGDRLNPFNDDDAQTLVKLGLTFSQAKIYLTLLALGTTDVKKIAQIAGVDRGEVYRQIEVLLKKDLLEKIIEIPNKFKPIVLNEAIKTLVQQKNKENVELDQKVKKLLEKGVNSDQITFDDSRISIIPSDHSKRQLPKRYEHLQKEEVWYTQIENIPFCLDLWDNTFKKAFSRGIKLRAIAELNQPTEAIFKLVQNYGKENPNFILRFDKPTLLTSFAVYDETEMTIYTEKKSGASLELERPVLWTTNPVLIGVFKDYFELRWKNAMTKYP